MPVSMRISVTDKKAALIPSRANAAAIVELFPIFSRVRMLRQWGGIVDVCPDACPIISKMPVKGLYFNCGWGTGGFKGNAWFRLGIRAHHRAGSSASVERSLCAGPIYLGRFD